MSHSVAVSQHDAAVARARAMPALANPAEEAKRLTLILAPSNGSQGLRALSYLFKNLPMANIDLDGTEEDRAASERMQLEGYKIAIRGFPVWAIVEARDAFIGGRVAAHDGPFAPNSAVFGRECARRVDDYRGRLGRAQRLVRETIDDAPVRPLGPAAREAGQRLIAELRAGAEEDRRLRAGGRRAATDAMDEIPGDMIDAMRQLPDAPLRDGGFRRAALPDRYGLGRGRVAR